MKTVTIILLVAVAAVPLIAQTNLEARVTRLEQRLDSLINALRGITPILAQPENINLQFGVMGPTGTLLDKGYFVINHNNDWKIPYWVAYYLSTTNLQGNQGRTNDFRPDPDLSEESRSELADYRNSGFDRGHNAPAADFKRSREAMSTTFLLSNMCPQTPNLNQQIWNRLEQQVRNVTIEQDEAWIFTGNLFMAADSSRIDPQDHIGANQVAIPTHCYKAILFRDAQGEYAMYAFLMPNIRQYIPGPTINYQITVDRLEQITGFDFFPLLDDANENYLEARIFTGWPQ